MLCTRGWCVGVDIVLHDKKKKDSHKSFEDTRTSKHRNFANAFSDLNDTPEWQFVTHSALYVVHADFLNLSYLQKILGYKNMLQTESFTHILLYILQINVNLRVRQVASHENLAVKF
jgi:hypothetical protein